MRLPVPIRSAFACLTLAALAGCGSEPALPAVAALDPAAEVVAAEPDEADALVEVEPPQTPMADYQPPYPNRRELFFPPDNARRSAKRSGNGYESAVELLGFARLNQPYALLSIDGETTAVAEGDQRSGVQVISIQGPDAAVLQRGRNRWTATLQ